MNNEPVAYVDNVWINRPDLAMDLGIGQMFSRCQLSDHQIPLYTNLVKELTEWEMKECWEEATEGREHFCSQYFDFAQLILRKAQEK